MSRSDTTGAMFYFAIVGRKDNPLYESEFGQAKREMRYLNQMIAHASLDMIDEQVWTPGSDKMYLKSVDKFNQYHVSGFVTASCIRFVLLHSDTGKEENIKNFFSEVYENFIKISVNPFYEPNTPIKNAAFHQRVEVLAKKFLLS
ncbi:trafficking protein particle complex subunit 2-like [Convolutriloba macropyga]|uniref:trafficking protein particle complex subunit 2-like n=1 Tax=Convolutriloba macropyga TaxID=536237 RepID=UPI003F525EE1